MRILSATDAISPAVARTRDLLFRPFHWGTFLKLCAVAVFTEGLSGKSNFGRGGGGGTHWKAGGVITTITPQMLFTIVAVCIAVLILGVILFYLATRLRFALFECLVHQSTEIRPGWHIYREPAQRFFWASLVAGLMYVLLVGILLSPFLLGMYRRMHEGARGAALFGEMLQFLVPMIPVIVLLVLIAIAMDIVLRDFMLPHFALDNASASQALEAVWNDISAEKGAFFLYAVLRILLPIAALIALAIALLIPGIILFGGGGVLIALLKAAAVNGSGGVVFGAVSLQILVGVAMLALAIFLAIAFGGPLGIGVRNYALMFYGGRYRELGNTMFPPAPGLTT